MPPNQPEKTWNTKDLDFDKEGRLIIKNESLKQWFQQKVSVIRSLDIPSEHSAPGTHTVPAIEVSDDIILLACPDFPPRPPVLNCTELLLDRPIRVFKLRK